MTKLLILGWMFIASSLLADSISDRLCKGPVPGNHTMCILASSDAIEDEANMILLISQLEQKKLEYALKKTFYERNFAIFEQSSGAMPLDELDQSELDMQLAQVDFYKLEYQILAKAYEKALNDEIVAQEKSGKSNVQAIEDRIRYLWSARCAIVDTNRFATDTRITFQKKLIQRHLRASDRLQAITQNQLDAEVLAVDLNEIQFKAEETLVGQCENLPFRGLAFKEKLAAMKKDVLKKGLAFKRKD